jgi:hypothetical protein
MSERPDLLRVAKRVVWFKEPEDTIKDVKLFLAHLMTYGTLSDIPTTLRYFSEVDFESVLNDPLPSSTGIHGHSGTCAIVESRSQTFPKGVRRSRTEAGSPAVELAD